MASIGVIEDEEGTDIPSLMDSLLEEIGDEEKLKEDLISKCSKYGLFNIGYDHEHEEMRNWKPYTTKYSINFERYYNMSDTAIKVPRHVDIATFSHVIEKSVIFSINLPMKFLKQTQLTLVV